MSQTGLSTTKPPKQLSITDLYKDKVGIVETSQLATVLNSEPAPNWISQGQQGDYIPIETIEWLLTRVFGHWYVEILESKIIANSVVVTVRLYVRNPQFDPSQPESPVNKPYLHNDGIGANPLQTDKGAGAIEFDKIKNGAVQAAAPSAKSYAVKDAAEQFGRLFGRDIGRKTRQEYSVVMDKFTKDDKYAALLNEGGKGE